MKSLSKNLKIKPLLKFFDLKKSTYYKIAGKPETVDKYAFLKQAILSLRDKYKNYSAKSIYHQLRRDGFKISYKTLFKVYSNLNLQLLRPKSKKKPEYYDKIKPLANLKKTNKPDKPFEILATDGVEMKAGNKTVHFAFVIDLHSRFILCFNSSENENTEFYNELLCKVHKMLPYVPEKGIIHTDQGSVFTSKAFHEHVLELGYRHSMSAKGTPTDNSIIENFHHILKSGMYNRQKYKSSEELIQSVTEFVRYYNYHRLSSKEGSTPFERLLSYFRKDIKIEKFGNITDLVFFLKHKILKRVY